ncbi:unnamed protein product [Linum tenue]|nr:unnamed protein product [Linum tenue]
MKLFDLKSPPCSSQINGAASSLDVMVDPSRNLWLRLYRPWTSAATPLPVIIYFHGGGFCTMGADSRFYDIFCRSLASETPAVVVSVNYRLAPEHRCPSQYEDGFDAVKFLDAVINLDGVDLGRCFLAGDSAGGNLAHHVAVRAAESEAALKRVKITGLISIQPFFGGEERTESEMRMVGVPVINMEATDWAWRSFLPEGSDRNHPAANVLRLDVSKVVGFPAATMVVVGGFDPLQDRQRSYHEWLVESGKEGVELLEYPNAVHAFYLMPDLPETPMLLADIRDFIQRHAARPFN